MQVLLMVVAIGALAAKPSGCESKSESSSSSSSSTSSSTKSPGPPMDVTAAKLSADYEANELAADETYKRRVLMVSGTVDSIGKDILDKPYVTLKGKTLVGVQAYFEDTNGLTSLRKGQKVTLSCIGDGATIGTPMLKDCSIP